MKIPTSLRHSLIIVVAILCFPRIYFDCGPFLPRAVFFMSSSPDFPRKDFLKGQLGILQPTYRPRYLLAAYRQLMNHGVSLEEQKAIMTPYPLPPEDPNEWREQDPLSMWMTARGRVTGVGEAAKVDPYRTIMSTTSSVYYGGYLNCTGDAFKNAAKILESRINTLGAANADVREWVLAQDTVFSNCHAGERIPSPLQVDASPILRADRDYQIAAAYFYAGNFEEARNRFDKISQDPSSPWASLAPYLAVRALIRKATVNDSYGKVDAKALAEAQSLLGRILRDSRYSSSYPAARGALNFVRARLEPRARLIELGKALSKKSSRESFRQDLIDYIILLDKGAQSPPSPIKSSPPDAAPTGESSERDVLPPLDDMTDWITTFQSKTPQELKHSLEKWDSAHSLPWLVASLSLLPPHHPRQAELSQAAARLTNDSPAFATLAYHGLRLLVDSGQDEEALRRVNGLLKGYRDDFPPSSLDMLQAIRMHEATTLDEFLDSAQRIPSGISLGFSFDFEEAEEKPLFDTDAVKVLNEQVPLRVLLRAVHASGLPEPLRRDVAISTWARAAFIDNEQVANEAARILAKLAPQMKESLEMYLSAKDTAEKRFDASLIVMRFPGIRLYLRAGLARQTRFERIDDFHDNWWCSCGWTSEIGPKDKGPGHYDSLYTLEGPSFQFYTGKQLTPVRFLTDEDLKTGRAEWQKIYSLPTAPNLLAGIVLPWARQHPKDPRVPEALHFVVRATRYGCSDKESGKFSKEAYSLLHQRYPEDPWTRKTPYWFK